MVTATPNFGPSISDRGKRPASLDTNDLGRSTRTERLSSDRPTGVTFFPRGRPRKRPTGHKQNCPSARRAGEDSDGGKATAWTERPFLGRWRADLIATRQPERDQDRRRRAAREAVPASPEKTPFVIVPLSAGLGRLEEVHGGTLQCGRAGKGGSSRAGGSSLTDRLIFPTKGVGRPPRPRRPTSSRREEHVHYAEAGLPIPATDRQLLIRQSAVIE